MKKWLSHYRAYMIRPILYKVVARSAIAVAVLLLWNRYVNTRGQLSLGRDGCFVVGVLFLAFAWFSYLKFDGVSFHHLFEKREGEKKKPVRRGTSDIVDFADEHIVSFAELGEREQALCSLTANLIGAVIFVFVSVLF